MRVLVLHSRYSSGPASGENRVVDDESRLLSEAGHSVHVWAPTLASHRSTLRTGINAIWSRSAVDATAAAIKTHRPDVVHVHNLFPVLSPAVIRAARDEGVPVVMTIHNFRLACLAATLLRDGSICEDCIGHLPWRGLLHGCYRGSRPASAALFSSLSLHRMAHTFDAVTRFLVVSRFVYSRLASIGIDTDRAVVRPNFAWENERRSGPGDYFLYLGRISVEKGVAPLAATWSAKSPLVIAGDGPEMPALRRAARNRNVELLGTVDPQRAAALLTKARALVLPSLCFEGSPRSVVEAFASGVAVIASDIGGIPEHVEPNRSGILVAPGVSSGWLEAVDQLEDDALSSALGAGAYEAWRTSYSPASSRASLESAYRAAIEAVAAVPA